MATSPSTMTLRLSQELDHSASGLAEDFMRTLRFDLGRDRFSESNVYNYQALVKTLREHLMPKWLATHQACYEGELRRGYYISMEFLIGRSLRNALLNLDLDDTSKEALAQVGVDLEEVAEAEPDAGLGNGGLGRLAACFLDSCATLQLPVMGYGIRYEYGMFKQAIVNGFQKEHPDHWLMLENPWEIVRHEYTQNISFGGHTEFYNDENGYARVRWVPGETVLAIPYDMPIPGYRNGTVNTLRLWKSAATESFNLNEFNAGDYAAAVTAKNTAENISMILYPNDKSENGKELRLRQQYFLASASLQDIVRRWRKQYGNNFSQFAEKNVCQLNDTHPTVGVAELMRILLDEERMSWDDAWAIVGKTFAYTNHTLLPEALERWPVAMFQRLLPRLLEIIYEINARFLRQVANKWPGDGDKQARLSIIEDGPEQQVRMAHLAIVGSFSINGVAQLHTDLLIAGLFNEFYQLWPERFNNKTNGVTQRRWLAACNPGQNELMTKHIGESWVTNLSDLQQLAPLADDAAFRQQWQAVKQANKEKLAELIKQECGVSFPTNAIFDVQVKRIHEYKRQLLPIFHAIHLYRKLKAGETITPRCILIGGKAAPGYARAKEIIKLCNNVAEVINSDPDCQGSLAMAFLPNYRVTSMETICPGTDLSEQVSTAGKEASGTGNMKFMMNGALTIGTLDGANIEIREEVGEEHFFLFGLTADEIAERRASHDPQAIIASNPDLAGIFELLSSGHFNPLEPGIFDSILRDITEWGDYWMVVADLADYLRAQADVDAAYLDQDAWVRSSILNAATSGKFSTDRTMTDYNDDIWHLEPVTPSLTAST